MQTLYVRISSPKREISYTLKRRSNLDDIKVNKLSLDILDLMQHTLPLRTLNMICDRNHFNLASQIRFQRYIPSSTKAHPDAPDPPTILSDYEQNHYMPVFSGVTSSP